MPRLTDVDALLKDITHRYCENCERRKGIKNGKKKFIYDIGDAPCRACEVDDMKDELENAPTVDAVEVVRCKNCKWFRVHKTAVWCGNEEGLVYPQYDSFCSCGERREDAETD